VGVVVVLLFLAARGTRPIKDSIKVINVKTRWHAPKRSFKSKENQWTQIG